MRQKKQAEELHEQSCMKPFPWQLNELPVTPARLLLPVNNFHIDRTEGAIKKGAIALDI